MWTLNFYFSDFNGDLLTDDALERERRKNPGMKEGHAYRAREYAQDLKKTGQKKKEDNEMIVYYHRW